MRKLGWVFLGLVGGGLTLAACSDGSIPEPDAEGATSATDVGEPTRTVKQTLPEVCCSSKSDQHFADVHKMRRIIVNSDGNDVNSKKPVPEPPAGMSETDAVEYRKTKARELFLEPRMERLDLNATDVDGNPVNQIDTIVYETTGGGFGGFFHPTEVGEKRDWGAFSCSDEGINQDHCGHNPSETWAATLQRCSEWCNAWGATFTEKYPMNQYIDPLQEAIDYVKGRSVGAKKILVNRPREIFWGLRMNDTHDVMSKNNNHHMLFSDLKRDQQALADNDADVPGFLFARDSRGLVPTSYSRGGLPLLSGRWSAVDYDSSQVRQFVKDAVKEVLDNYDVDGIQLNFMRHGVFFRRTAWWGQAARADEIGAMNTLLADIRALTNAAAATRGHSVLISVIVPDSSSYAKFLGLDLKNWVENGNVDLITGGDYMQLRRWHQSVEELATWQGLTTPDPSQQKVLFHAGFTDTRMEREASNPPDMDLRQTAEALRGRALEAWSEGVSGIHLSNPVWNNKYAPLYTQLGDKYTASGDGPDLPATPPSPPPPPPEVARVYVDWNDTGADVLQFGSFMGHGENPGNIPDFDAYFASYYAPTPPPAGTTAQVAAPDSPWKLLGEGQRKRWEFRLGRGKKQTMFYVYVRTEDITSAQRDGGLYVDVESPGYGKVRLTRSGYWSATPAQLVDPAKDKNGTGTGQYSGQAYHPRLLRFSHPDAQMAKALLDVPTLKVEVVNSSTTPVWIEDIYVHSTLAASRPGLLDEVHCFDGECSVPPLLPVP
jgi:hypothetical protein